MKPEITLATENQCPEMQAKKHWEMPEVGVFSVDDMTELTVLGGNDGSGGNS
ncbi:MAG: hypothetical protein PHU06_00130 [Gallionella sp.]|nr:hypothetical protein [Gallionella sp.]MDD4958642.1 hypothetical protein [Gallionella sp.]